MNTSFEDQIRERAYHLWLAGGMADGLAHEHWACAERAVLGDKSAEAEPVVIITKAEPKPAKARKAAAKPAAKPAAKTTKIGKAKPAGH